MTCKEHDFRFNIQVYNFEDKPGNGAIDLTAVCKICGVPMIFYGPRGASASFPVASADRTELRAPVTFGYKPKFIPGPDVILNGPELKNKFADMTTAAKIAVDAFNK